MDSTLLWSTIAAMYGLLFGSFANVVVWRFPRGESLVRPSSHCPDCSSPIQWYDNIPVASWLVLRGRCRNCGVPISLRYPVIELLSALLWALGVLAFGPSLRAVFAIAFYYVLLILAAIDIDTFRLPNVLVAVLAGGGAVGVVVSEVTGTRVVPLIDASGSALQAALTGAVLSAGTALLIALVYQWARNAQGFGFGDVKLLAVIGLFLGPHGVLSLFVASMVGAMYGIAVSRKDDKGMRAMVPFGPFLAGAAILVSVVGPQVWSAYMRLVTW